MMNNMDNNENKPDNNGNHIGMGMIGGVAIGNVVAIVVGSQLGNVPIAMCFGSGMGMCIGMVVGAVLNKKSKNKN